MKHPLAIGTRIVSHRGEQDSDDNNEERHAAPGEIGEIVSVDSIKGISAKNYGVVFYPSGVWVFIDSNELAVAEDYTVLETVEDELWQLVSNYRGVMEDYDAGYPITNPDHPHHDDWVRAKKILDWLAARKRLNDEAEDTP